jgi:hypothetical protein
MAISSTLSWLVDEIERKFGRGSVPDFKGGLFMDINREVDRLTRRWKFWFMNAEPGTALSFPISSLSALDLTRGRWADQGWLVTLADKYDNTYYMPTSNTISVQATAATSDVTQPSRWVPGEISNLNFVHFYDANGVYRSEIQIIPETEWWRRANLKTSGLPVYATFKTELDGVSRLLVTPKPNDVYLFQVSARLATLPPLDRPESTHAMLMYYPHVVLKIGLVEAASYFGDQARWMIYMSELHGADFLQRDNPNFTPGGMIGEMIADTRNRVDNRYLTAKVYKSSAAAFGRNGPRRNVGGGYYVSD